MKDTHSLYIFKHALGSTVAGPTLRAVRICFPTDNLSYHVLFTTVHLGCFNPIGQPSGPCVFGPQPMAALLYPPTYSLLPKPVKSQPNPLLSIYWLSASLFTNQN